MDGVATDGGILVVTDRQNRQALRGHVVVLDDDRTRRDVEVEELAAVLVDRDARHAARLCGPADRIVIGHPQDDVLDRADPDDFQRLRHVDALGVDAGIDLDTGIRLCRADSIRQAGVVTATRGLDRHDVGADRVRSPGHLARAFDVADPDDLAGIGFDAEGAGGVARQVVALIGAAAAFADADRLVDVAVDLVVTDRRVRVALDRDTVEAVAEDLVVLDHAAAAIVDIDTRLLTVAHLVVVDLRVGIGLDLDPGIGVAVDLVAGDARHGAVRGHDAALLTVADGVARDHRVVRGLHLDPRQRVVEDRVAFEPALATFVDEDARTAAIAEGVALDDRVGALFQLQACQRVAEDRIAFQHRAARLEHEDTALGTVADGVVADSGAIIGTDRKNGQTLGGHVVVLDDDRTGRHVEVEELAAVLVDRDVRDQAGFRGPADRVVVGHLQDDITLVADTDDFQRLRHVDATGIGARVDLDARARLCRRNGCGQVGIVAARGFHRQDRPTVLNRLLGGVHRPVGDRAFTLDDALRHRGKGVVAAFRGIDLVAGTTQDLGLGPHGRAGLRMRTVRIDDDLLVLVRIGVDSPVRRRLEHAALRQDAGHRDRHVEAGAAVARVVQADHGMVAETNDRRAGVATQRVTAVHQLAFS